MDFHANHNTKNINDHTHPSYSSKNSYRIVRNINTSSYPNNRSRRQFRQHSTLKNSKGVRQTRVSTLKQQLTRNKTRRDIHVNAQNEININSTSKKERKRRPWFIWIISLIQICTFIGEIIHNWILTKRPIETNLSINPLFGPSPFVLINIGASFSPCMHSIDSITNNLSSTNFPCPNTTNVKSIGCTLSDLCGFNGISDMPNQWYRFILSIFLHAGIVHIFFNLLGQFLIGAEIERKIGPLRTIFIYFASGIFGFIFGGNFGPQGLTRVGCSGSLFSIIALSLLHLFYNWKQIKHPKIQLIAYLIDIIINFVLGLLPGIDNFSHIGGFCMGLLLGLAILGSPSHLRRYKKKETSKNMINQWDNLRWHQRFFSNRPKHWWTWWFVRFIAFSITITIFVLLTENFYSRRMTCSWCKYISCLPVNGWCNIGVFITKNGSIIYNK